MVKKINILYVIGWILLNGALIAILSQIYMLIFLILYILYELSKHYKNLNKLFERMKKKFNNFFINLNDPSKSFLRINNYLTLILFFFAINEILIVGYNYNQMLSGTPSIYEILLIFSLAIFSMINIYFGGWVQYNMSKIYKTDLESV